MVLHSWDHFQRKKNGQPFPVSLEVSSALLLVLSLLWMYHCFGCCVFWVFYVPSHLSPPSPPSPPSPLTNMQPGIPWQAWTVAAVEFVERFSYYGTSAVFVNFIQKPLPPGSRTGAGFLKKPGSGALGMGQRASTGLTMFNQFWSYITPLGGAWIADEYIVSRSAFGALR